MKTTMMMLLLVLGSLGVSAQHDHAAHDKKTMDKNMATFKDEKLGSAYAHYAHLRDALVASDETEAKNAAEALLRSLSSVKDAKKATDAAAKVSAASSLDDQRKSFSALSNEMASLLKGGKLSNGELYLAYCPMANDDEGAYWVSNDKSIKNPYFGDKMLKCGSVKNTIQ